MPHSPLTAIAPSALEATGSGLPRASTPAPVSEARAEAFRALLESAEAGARTRPAEGTAGLSGAPATAPTGADALEAFYQRAREGSRALDSVIAEARAGRTFSSQELIGLQARIYRATLVVETFSKVVESTSSGARQLLGTNL